jgi:hypothetical protein
MCAVMRENACCLRRLDVGKPDRSARSAKTTLEPQRQERGLTDRVALNDCGAPALAVCHDDFIAIMRTQADDTVNDCDSPRRQRGRCVMPLREGAPTSQSARVCASRTRAAKYSRTPCRACAGPEVRDRPLQRRANRRTLNPSYRDQDPSAQCRACARSIKHKRGHCALHAESSADDRDTSRETRRRSDPKRHSVGAQSGSRVPTLRATTPCGRPLRPTGAGGWTESNNE